MDPETVARSPGLIGRPTACERHPCSRGPQVYPGWARRAVGGGGPCCRGALEDDAGRAAGFVAEPAVRSAWKPTLPWRMSMYGKKYFGGARATFVIDGDGTVAEQLAA